MSDAGQMGCRLEAGFVDDALDRGVGSLAGRAAGAIGDRDERRRQGLKPADRLPQIGLGLGRFRRLEFEGDFDSALVGDEIVEAHAASARDLASDWASQSFTVSLFLPAAIASLASGFNPAAANQPCTSRSENPSRRWAKSLRRNSRSCGAKSAINKRPPGRITRAASATAAPGSSR